MIGRYFAESFTYPWSDHSYWNGWIRCRSTTCNSIMIVIYSYRIVIVKTSKGSIHLPNWPHEFKPNANTRPRDGTYVNVWRLPHVTCDTCVPIISTTIRGKETLFLFPWPNCPKFPAPQENTPPSIVRNTEKSSPADTFRTPIDRNVFNCVG